MVVVVMLVLVLMLVLMLMLMLLSMVMVLFVSLLWLVASPISPLPRCAIGGVLQRGAGQAAPDQPPTRRPHLG